MPTTADTKQKNHPKKAHHQNSEQMNTTEFCQKVRNNEVDIVEQTHKAIQECRKIDKEYHYFNVISEELAISQAEAIKKNPKGNLAGVFVSVKDCICVKDMESRAGSRILSGYKPVFDATVIERLKKEGAIIIGKTSQDEFGFGSFSTNVGVDFKIPLNPFDKERACGGSSGGSAGITQKLSFPHISIGESTGGSIVNPASFCGVYGLCPTYGRVSRYGLIDYANSLDKIGPFAKDIQDMPSVQQAISGHDKRESTTIRGPVEDYSAELKNGAKGLRVGIVKEALAEGIDQPISKKVWDYVKKLENEGVRYQEVSLPLNMKYGIQTYYIIATCETSTNLAKLCGMRYGKHDNMQGSFNEYFSKVRAENFGKEAKRRIIIGTFARMAGFREAYYIKAAKVRTMLINEYKKIFKSLDVIITPTMAVLPPKFSDIEKLTPLQNYMMDILTVGPNLAGMPHMNIPIGMEQGLPVGALATADHLKESTLMRIAACQ
jgi:aspartyl-tRNA(Asn)/glutamyl-tRNA(Gln) amidotransferase subunit A